MTLANEIRALYGILPADPEEIIYRAAELADAHESALVAEARKEGMREAAKLAEATAECASGAGAKMALIHLSAAILAAAEKEAGK